MWFWIGLGMVLILEWCGMVWLFGWKTTLTFFVLVGIIGFINDFLMEKIRRGRSSHHRGGGK